MLWTAYGSLRPVRAALVIVLLCVGSVTLARGAGPMVHRGAQLVYDAQEVGNPEIYLLDVERSLTINLTRHPAHDCCEVWSPDGQYMAFRSNRSGNWEIYRMDADGRNLLQLTNNNRDDFDPAWSPDNQTLVFVSDYPGEADIYRMDADGAHITQLTDAAGNDEHPLWSPNGRQIAFLSDRTGSREIFVMNADGSDPRQITAARGDEQLNGWSPDGRYVIFNALNAGRDDLYLIDVQAALAAGAGADTRIQLTDSAAHDYLPTWSPDGQHIAFVSERDRNRNIYLLDVTAVLSGGERPPEIALITNNRSDYSPVWSPDGHWLAFVSGRRGRPNIYLLDLSCLGAPLTCAGTEHQVTEGQSWNYRPSWRPG